MSLPTTTVRDGGGVGGWVWAARDCGPTPEPYYTTTKLWITSVSANKSYKENVQKMKTRNI